MDIDRLKKEIQNRISDLNKELKELNNKLNELNNDFDIIEAENRYYTILNDDSEYLDLENITYKKYLIENVVGKFDHSYKFNSSFKIKLDKLITEEFSNEPYILVSADFEYPYRLNDLYNELAKTLSSIYNGKIKSGEIVKDNICFEIGKNEKLNENISIVGINKVIRDLYYYGGADVKNANIIILGYELRTNDAISALILEMKPKAILNFIMTCNTNPFWSIDVE